MTRTARTFPKNTCPASRHVELMADALKRGWLNIITDEPWACAASMRATVEALYAARTRVAELEAMLKERTEASP